MKQCLYSNLPHGRYKNTRHRSNEQLESTGAQLAFSNGWRYGAPIVPGNITLNDLYNIIPMNPPVSTVELSGQEIREMLEENLEKTFSCDARVVISLQ